MLLDTVTYMMTLCPVRISIRQRELTYPNPIYKEAIRISKISSSLR